MQLTLTILRFLFIALCTVILCLFAISSTTEEHMLYGLVGALSGIVLGILIVSLEMVAKRINTRLLNTLTLGLLFGFLLGQAIIFTFDLFVTSSSFKLSSEVHGLFSLILLLGASYFGMATTFKSAEEIYMSIPFFHLKKNEQKRKDFLLDQSIIYDARLIDLASSGILDYQLVIPRFLVKELQEQLENADEGMRHRARRALDNVKKLENMSCELRYSETDFPEIKDPLAKLIKLARLNDSSVLTADTNRVQHSLMEGVRFININALANALKPLAQMGETLSIKIQRYGKEPRQGVGYLDDGTMVVVNGGAEFIGETIQAQVLSVKHTSSGRMIFCNAMDDLLYSESGAGTPPSESEIAAAKSYFAL